VLVPSKPPAERKAGQRHKLIAKQRRNQEKKQQKAEKAARRQRSQEYAQRHGPAALAKAAADQK
jgi:hypothetical protein